MCTPVGKTRKGDCELKWLECSVDYDVKGGKSRRGRMGRDHKTLR